MSISLVYGLPGKNKTHFSLYYGLSVAEKYKKPLVCNFLLNPFQLMIYCKYMGYGWLLENIPKGKIIYYISLDKDLKYLLSIPRSVVICDEAAIYFPSRGSTWNTPKEVIAGLVQVRHKQQNLLVLAQSEKQIDNAIKELAEEIFYCNGMTVHNPKLDKPILVMKNVKRFTSENFRRWIDNPKARANPLKTKWLSNKSWDGTLTVADKYLFSVYQSFNDVTEEDQIIKKYCFKTFSKDRKKNEQLYLYYDYPEEKKDIIFKANQPKPVETEKKIVHPSIKGSMPFMNSHKYIKYSQILFKKMPGYLLPLFFKLDKLLSIVANYQFNKYEILFIKAISIYFAIIFLMGLVL